MDTQKKARIFISYKRVDKDRVFAIKDGIKKATGEECWIDLDGIESADQFSNVIVKAINRCEVFLFMYSKEHAKISDFEEDWTIKEITFAKEKKKRIVIVNIDDTPLIDQFLIEFPRKQRVDAADATALARLYKDLCSWLKIDINKIQQDSSKAEQERLRKEKELQAEVIIKKFKEWCKTRKQTSVNDSIKKFKGWCKTRKQPTISDSKGVNANDKADYPTYTRDELEDVLSSLDDFVAKDGFHYSKDYDNLGLRVEVCEQNMKLQRVINIPEKVEVLKWHESGTYTKYILPVTSIGYCAFENYSNLTKITIPQSVVTIKEGAFRDCTQLRFIKIPNNVKFIGNQAFSRCTSLKSIVLPSETNELVDRVFEYCCSLEIVEFTSVAKRISSYAFYGCYSLQTVLIPKGSMSIFEECCINAGLTEILPILKEK